MIQIYDSMHKKVVPFEPREDGRVSMYLCGPTVYNYIHIGNARTILWFDLIRRYLTYRGSDVTYVMNYTDVDDKIIERANFEKLPPEAIAAKYERAFEDVIAALGGKPADIVVRATQHIDDMIKAIQGLIEKGSAYESGGDVFFAVENFQGYGKLAGRTLDDMRAGERIEPNEAKRNPLDFALWKAAKEGEPAWPSPWGPGRPGWHIECSVMSTRYLGMGFDIHGGGTDLIFPHHENEIAQAEALEGTQPFVRHWMHAGMVQMDQEKMSKSLGNFVLANDMVEAFSPEGVRYWALMGSYRTQVSFSEPALNDALQAYERWRTFLDSARHALGDDMPVRPPRVSRPLSQPVEDAHPAIMAFVAAMDDDFNSAEAFAAIHDLVRQGNKTIEPAQSGEPDATRELKASVEAFLELTSVLGFSFSSGDNQSELVGVLVEYLLELREDARQEKAFDRADAIRTRLIEMGVAVEDTAAGPRWRVSLIAAPERPTRTPRSAARAQGEAETERLLYGRRPVVELLRAGGSVERIFIADTAGASETIAEVRRRAQEAAVPVRSLPRRELDRLVGAGNHQGVAALTAQYRYVPFERLLGADDPALLFLDGLMDPHNLGSLLRSADGAGFTGVVIPSRRAVQVTATVRRVSAGAAEVVPVARVTNISNAIDQAKEHGVWIVGLDGSADNDIYSSELMEPPLGLVLGAEDRGIAEKVRSRCDGLVRIPSSGRLSSLNVAVAGALAMFELSRRRISAGSGKTEV